MVLKRVLSALLPTRYRSEGKNQQPPDLDELWRDLSQRIRSLLGGSKQQPPQHNAPTPPSSRPELPNNAGRVIAILVIVVGLGAWLGSGFFKVGEGQLGVVTQFGKYSHTTEAGWSWRLPYPIQNDEVINATQIRTVEIGSNRQIPATGLREAAMLTADENIVEVKFSVQYRVKDPREYLFENVAPDMTVAQVAESAVREVVGKMKMDEVLSNRSIIAPRVQELMQKMLDRYKVGIEISSINLSQNGVRPPEQVKVAFDDVLRANQEAEGARNEAQAYANDVVPRAKGAAARLREEAQGYSERVVSQAKGDGDRFSLILPEYLKSPKSTRDRMYLDAMQKVYQNTTKILTDTKQGLLYLPLDKILQNTAPNANGANANPNDAATSKLLGASAQSGASNNRSRDTTRTR